MNKFLLALMAALFLAGCASMGGGSGGALPEIAPYDEPTYEPLPKVVPSNS